MHVLVYVYCSCSRARSASYIHAATKMMVKDIQYESYPDQIVLTWLAPEYPPFMYDRATYCTIIDQQESYLTSRETIDADAVQEAIDVRPNSICTIIFFAVYNRAATDAGIPLKVRTPTSSTL